MSVQAEPRETNSRAEGKRRQIRDAAQSLFLEHGFEGTSMDAVTASARVSKRTLYNYYPSKEALLGDIVHQLTVGDAPGSRDVTEVPVARTRAELEDLLVRIAAGIVRNHQSPAFLGLVRIIIAESPRFPDLGDQYYRGVIAPGLAFLASIIDRARDAGVVKAPESDTGAVVRLYMGGILISTFNNGLINAAASHWLTADELRSQVRLLLDAIT